MFDISIVILHYNNDQLTDQCINSIINTTIGYRYNIIVIDNNSSIKYEHPKAIVVRNDNHYSVSGMNLGFLTALRHDPEFIVNFDNDIICLNGWANPLVREMRADKTVGIAGGKQFDKDKKMFRSVGSDMVGGHLYQDAPQQTQEVHWIQGSAVMFRAEMMRKIGVHDDRFKILCSDSDYCFHAKNRGWKVLFVADSEVIHLGGATYTEVCETWEEDNKALLKKWTGQSGMDTLAGLPLSTSDKRIVKIIYKVENEN